MTCECTGVCVYKMACRRSLSRVHCRLTLSPPPFDRQTKALSHFKGGGRGRPSGECPASAHTAPLCTRLGSRAGSLSAHPAAARAPCALPPSLSPPVPREQVIFGRSRWVQLACTAAPQLVREVAAHIMRRPSAPAAAPPRPLQPPQPLARTPLEHIRNAWFTWQGLLARLRRTELPGGTASAIVVGRCPAGACAFQPRPDTSRLAYFPTAGRRRQ